MSVPSTTSLIQAAIAALGQAFNPPFSIQNYSDIALTYTNASTLADTTLVLNVDFFVTGAFTAGECPNPTVTLEPTGLHYAVGGTLTIQRLPPATQPTTFVDGTKYLAATTNAALDWLCYSVQALWDVVNRCLRVPPSSAVQAAIALAARESMLLGFDHNGNVALYAYPTTPGAATGIVNNANLVGPTGGGATHLDGIDASQYALGTIIQFVLGGMAALGAGVPAPMTQYMLVTSALATGDGVVAALNVAAARWIRIL